MKRIFWAAFWIMLATTLCSAQSTLYFPQIADGQNGGFGWVTAVAITNAAPAGTSLATGTLSFTKDDGTAFNIPLVDVQGAPVAVSGGNVPFQIAGGQTRLYLSAGIAPLITVGYATVTSNLPVTGGAIFFEYSTQTGSRIAEAGVAAATPLMQQASIVSKLNQDTGVAVANPGTQTTTLTFQLLDTSGAQVLPPVNRAVAAKNHTAFFVSQLFPSLQNNFFGTMRITSDNLPVVTTALLFEADGKFSTLPVFPLQ